MLVKGQKLALNFGDKQIPNFKKKILKNVITDRKSKYTVLGGLVTSKEEIEQFMKEILKDKYFRKATHNSFAYRIELENGSVLEVKNDDGEKGAGNCILRELQRKNSINILVIVTRYFGGIHLQSDRFKHVISATKIFLKEL